MFSDRFNIVALWAAKLTNVLVAIVTVPLILNGLGVQVFGLWQLCSQIAAALVLLELGVTNASIRVLSQYEGTEKAPQAFQAALLFFISLSALLAIVAWPGGYYLSELSNLPPEAEAEGTIIFASCFFFAAATLSMRVFTSYLFSKHRFVAVSLTELTCSLLKLVFLYYAQSSGELSISVVILIVFGLQILAQVIQVVWAFLVDDGVIRASLLPSLNLDTVLYLVRQSGVSIQVTLGALIVNSGLIFYLGYASDYEMIAIVSIATYILAAISPFAQTFTAVAGPRAAKIRDTESRLDLMKGFYTAQQIVVLPLLALALFLMAFGDIVFEWWLRTDEWSKSSYVSASSLTAVLISVYAVTFFNTLFKTYLLGEARYWIVGINEILSALAGFIVSILYYRHLGTESALIIGFATTQIIRAIFYPCVMNELSRDIKLKFHWSGLRMLVLFAFFWALINGFGEGAMTIFGDSNIVRNTSLITIFIFIGLWRDRKHFSGLFFGADK